MSIEPKRNRPEYDDIEVTAEMIEAGEIEYYGYNPEMESEADGLKRLFLAMWRARPKADEPA